MISSIDIADDASDKIITDCIHTNYLELGGTIPRDKFDDLLIVFYYFTLDTYMGDPPKNVCIEWDLSQVNPRIIVFSRWEQFMVNVGHTVDDAVRIFHACDAFSGYS
jgi:hypothetical protein